MHSLDHVNIVAFHAVISETDHYGIVMEYGHCGSLEDFVFKYKVRCSVSVIIASMCVCVSDSVAVA